MLHDVRELHHQRRLLRRHGVQRRHLRPCADDVRRRPPDVLRGRCVSGRIRLPDGHMPRVRCDGPDVLSGLDLHRNPHMRGRIVLNARGLRRSTSALLQRQFVQPRAVVRCDRGRVQPRAGDVRRRRTDVLRNGLQSGPRVHQRHLPHEHRRHDGVRRRRTDLLRWNGLQSGPFVLGGHLRGGAWRRRACALRWRRSDLLRRNSLQHRLHLHRRRLSDVHERRPRRRNSVSVRRHRPAVLRNGGLQPRRNVLGGHLHRRQQHGHGDGHGARNRPWNGSWDGSWDGSGYGSWWHRFGHGSGHGSWDGSGHGSGRNRHGVWR